MIDSDQNPIEEWKATMENARHFNDLLIRFRMLGLPMFITLAVAGIAFKDIIKEIELWEWGVPIIALLIAILLFVSIIWHTCLKIVRIYKLKIDSKYVEEKQKPPITIYIFELILWVTFVGILFAFAIGNIISLSGEAKGLSFSNTSLFSPITITVFASVVLLLSLYVMDRFYYYKLLIGAVSRLVELEEYLKFSVTETTSKFIPRKYDTNLITTFYAMPGLILLIICCISYGD